MRGVDRRDNPQAIPEGLGGGNLTTGTGIEEWLKIVQEKLTASFPEPPIEYPGKPGISVGPGKPLDLGNIITLPSVPPVVIEATPSKAPASPGKSAGAKKAPDKKELPPLDIKPARVFTPPPPVRVILPTNKPTKGQPMDLGTIVTKGIDAALQYQQIKRGQAAAQPVFFGSDDTISDSVVEAIMGKPQTRRRRRRRLATLSDIRDLAALKSVLGNGEAFKTWIATHPS